VTEQENNEMTKKNRVVLTKRFLNPAPATMLMLACAGFMVAAILVPSTARPTTQIDDALKFSTNPHSAQIVIQDAEQFATSKENRMTTKAVIEGYFTTLKQKKGWDSFLAEDMVFTSFTSPVKQVTGKEAYLESTKRFYGGIVTFEVINLLIDGDKACALTRYQLQRPGSPVFESNVAEVFRIRDGKIVCFDIYFDSAPFPR
jgi:ketosteroid isomerase-like protein